MLIEQERSEYIEQNREHDDEIREIRSRLHPDERMVSCPPELLLPEEWETDETDRCGHVLGFGSFFDPITETFFGIRSNGWEK